MKEIIAKYLIKVLLIIKNEYLLGITKIKDLVNSTK